MMTTINLNEYYKENHAYEFLISSVNLFEKSGVSEFFKFDFSKEEDVNKKHELNHGRLKYTVDNLDEFNFMIVRLAIALELSLKGIAIHKGLNIFREGGKKLLKIDLLDQRSTKTYELGFFLDNLNVLLEEDKSDKYKEAFKFFQELRNEFIHFAKRQYNYGETGGMKHFLLLKDYFDTVVKPLKDEISLMETKSCQRS